MTEIHCFRVVASLFDRALFWLHGVRYRSIFTALSPSEIAVSCDCGGEAHITRLAGEDAGSAVVRASCKRWIRLGARQRATIPRAVATLRSS